MKLAYFLLATTFFMAQTLSLKADGLKINLGNDNFTSSTELIFTPTSKVAFEKGLDLEYRKLQGNNVNYIYSVADEKHKLYVNYLQRPSTYLAIDLQMVIAQAGTFNFSIEDRANNLTEFQFSLTDAATGKTIAITPETNTEMIFEPADVQRKKNFILHMYPAIKILASQVSCTTSKNGTIAIQFNPGCEWTTTLKNASSTALQTEKSSGEQFNFTNLGAGVYSVEIWLNNMLIREVITAISKPAGLQAKFTLSNDTIIPGKRISTNNNSMGGDRWNWNFGDGYIVSGYDVAHAYSAPGSYTVTLTASNTAGCIYTSTQSITVIQVNAKPLAIKPLSTY